ncbi:MULTISPECIES: helix-turn-helix domain-containing protein [Streptomyces]|uniref:HTH cro/C1-type domain-containing protein n=2 Tax=Streptomyces TaxID=1883 RepID=A0A1E7LJG7_9ACTN|nr:helix-turn-helix transcriptional regulator [Streptomyces nanshensis]OEV16370.1 hypothetical protein AN221_32740 [Streptomyces nanshensis]
MSDNDKFAEWLRSARSASGLSQGKVADAMNAEGFVFYQQTIAKVESGERPVRLDEATALARIFGVDLGDALGTTAGGGSKHAPPAEGDAPTLPVSARVIEKLRGARRANSVSARALAEAMTSAGYPIQRSVIANVESGRRAEISVDHLVAAAKALGLDPSALLRRVTEPCPHCHGTVPEGFTCNTCGGAA